jgi:S-layer protein
MSFRTNAVKVQAFAGAMFGVQVGSTTMAQINADITSAGGLSNALNGYYASSFGGATTASVAATVAANLGLTGDALTAGTAYVEAQLNAAAANARGAVISTILDQFAGLASDATFGAAATAYNDKVNTAVAYTGTTNVAIGTVVATSSVFTLTSGVDTPAGTAGNDTFNATAANLNAFDVITGGAGTDTLNIDDTAAGALASFSGVTLSGIEKININSKLGLLDAALNVSSATSFPGLTDLSIAMTTPAAAQTITAATTTNVTVSATAGGRDMVVVGGGGTASVTTTGAGIVTVGQNTAPASTDANAYTSVSARTATGAVNITDNSGTSGAIGSTLTSVSVRGTTGTSTLTGKGITSISLQDTTGAVNLTNTTTTAHAMDLNLKGVAGSTITDSSGNATSSTITTAATTAAATGNSATVAGAKIATLTLDGTKSLNLTSTLAKLETVKINGTGGVTSDFSDDGATTTSGVVTSVDASGSSPVASTSNGTTGNDITIGVTTTYTGGAGTDKVTVGASTKAITLGAGTDNLVLTAALGTGATVDAGDGTDTITSTNAIWAALTSSATINDKISNFERLEISNTALTTGNVTVDLGFMAKVNSYVKLGAFSGAAVQTINNVANAGTVEIAGDNTATGITIGVKDASYGTADSLTLALTATASGVRAGGAVTVAGVETINITTSMTATTYANNTDTLSLTAAAAKTIVVSGNQGLNLTGATIGTAITSVDASGLTGTSNVFSFTTGALVAATTAAPSATITGTSTGVNTIVATASLKPVIISVGGTANTASNSLTGSALADTISGGAGDDTITSGGGLDTLTGNGGKDTFVIADGSGTATNRVVITDYVRTASSGSSDLLDFTGTAVVSAITATGWTVTNGVYTKAGASVADFYTALSVAGSTALSVAAFANGGNTYVLYTGAGTTVADDVFVELIGVTGLTSVSSTTAGANALFIA